MRPIPPAKAAEPGVVTPTNLQVVRPALLDLRGYFILPKMTHQELERWLGRGRIIQVISLDRARVVVIAGGGAGLFDLRSGEVLWEIDSPTQCGALSQERTCLL